MESNLWNQLVQLGTVAGVVASATWFLFRNQSAIKDLVYSRTEEVKNLFSGKLDYHERHDDARFDNIRKDLIDIRIAQARFGTKTSKFNGNGNINGNSIRN